MCDVLWDFLELFETKKSKQAKDENHFIFPVAYGSDSIEIMNHVKFKILRSDSLNSEQFLL